MRPSDIIRGLAALTLTLGLTGAAALAEAPRRVVSVNLCTDQLAMMLAAPGQLVSVSKVARDPYSSAMAEEAAGMPVNSGRAEEVFALRPDLVLAVSWTDPYLLSTLTRLGVRVEVFDLVQTLDDIPALVTRLGAVLGREDAATARAAEFQRDLTALRSAARTPRSAVFYYPNGYTLGAGTLSDEILQAAGFRNLAGDLGYSAGGVMPLEELVQAKPDLVITAPAYAGASRAEEIMQHPVLRRVTEDAATVESGAEWGCGTPLVIEAIRRMAAVHDALPEARP